jgi:hypothetical protein
MREMLALTVAALTLVWHTAAGQATRAQEPPRPFADLTVPEARLPADCRLALVPQPKQTPSGVWVAVFNGPVAFSANPWTGQEARYVAAIRELVDGAPQLPDGPPLTRRQTSAYLADWYEEAVEAYLAKYGGPGEATVSVAAVRFNDSSLARPTRPLGTMRSVTGAESRVVRGSTVVQVSSLAVTTCFEVVRDYVTSLQ